MSRTVRVKNLIFGEGKPKLCIPLMGKNRQELEQGLAELHPFVESGTCDLVEWRVDHLDRPEDTAYTMELLEFVASRLQNCPLLVTFRTKAEGGAYAGVFDAAAYRKLLEGVIASGLADLVDIELLPFAGLAERLIAAAKKAGVAAVVSSHDFVKTPSRQEMAGRLVRMAELGADLPKLAVTPNSPEDLLELLCATQEASRKIDGPVVTMSMRGMGLLSRIAGECFGSAMTFGAAGKASAPGQIDAGTLAEMLEVLHQNLS